MKKCSNKECKQVNPQSKSCFSKDSKKKDGLQSVCKNCKKEYYQDNKEQIKEKKKEYRQNNKEQIKEKKKEYNKEYRQNNKEQIKEYYQDNKKHIKEQHKEYYQYNKKHIKERKKEYRQENKEQIKERHKEYEKERYKSDPIFKLKQNLRSRLRHVLNSKNLKKSKHTIDILGCSIEELKLHLESQFEQWMNWSNNGPYDPKNLDTWQIDHIEPLANAVTEEDVYRLSHYTNLRPLRAIDNIIKKDKW